MEESPATTDFRIITRRGWKLPLLGGLAVVGVGSLFLINPSTTPIFPPCPFYAITGLYCPICGLTRALHQLLHGNLLNALHFNALLVVSLPLIAWFLWPYAFSLLTGKSRRIRTLSPAWQVAVLLVLLVYGVIRNIPAYPFNLLAPL